MNDTIDNDTGEVGEPREMVVADENLRTQIAKMDKQFAAALPPHIPAERFTRVVQTALTGNPDLQKADRASLFEAAMKAAQDGLLPDGRDGALVIFNTKVKRGGREEWIKKVQWMPMVGGILKKIRNSGELLSISAHVVYTLDKFYYCLGDDEKIEHEPVLGENRGVPMCVYAIAKTKDGGIYREVMTLKDVEKVRNVSKAKDAGPWTQWWDEMARKSVIRRLAKRLPTSADLDDLLRHDDELYDFSGKRAEPAPFTPVHNPLKDDPEAPRGSSAAAAQADKIVSADGTVTKDRDPISSGPAKAGAPVSADQGGRGMDDPGIATSERTETASNEVTKSDMGAGEPEKPADAGSAAGATDTAPAQNNAQAASPPADDKPYHDAPTYMAYIRDQFDAAKGDGKVREVWGNTRPDRNELLDTDQIDELTKDKEAKLRSLKLKEGK